MNLELERTISAIIARQKITLSEAEIALLTSETSDERAAKLLAAHYFNTGQFDLAIEAATRAYDINGTPENESNLVSALLRARHIDTAIAMVSSKDTQLDPMRQASLMNELLARTTDTEQCRQWGLKALKLKDAGTKEAKQPVMPTLHRFNIDTPNRHVISFSLWGTAERYLRGALENAIATRYIYPGWTARFYVDSSVPAQVVTLLRQEGAEVTTAPDMPAAEFGLFWRFLVEDDESVALYLCRDADSVINVKERAAVADWLSSGKAFHVMRDHRTHSELVLARMWGAHRGNIGKMVQRIKDYRKARSKLLNSRIEDQLFLRDEIWPLMKDRVCVQDSFFGYKETHKFRPGMGLGPNHHIGQNMAAVTAAKSTGS